jgi:transposase
MILGFEKRGIYLYSLPVDMRKSYDSLGILVRNQMNLDLMSGNLFLFLNAKNNRLKILFWHSGGFCLFAKRLEKGTFKIPKNAPHLGGNLILEDMDLQMILSGFDPNFCKKLPRFSP